jgi:hypothetical protein
VGVCNGLSSLVLTLLPSSSVYLWSTKSPYFGLRLAPGEAGLSFQVVLVQRRGPSLTAEAYPL